MPRDADQAIGPLTCICATLSEMLIEAVANGGSVSFMHPLPRAGRRCLLGKFAGGSGARRRIVLGAFDGDLLVGTVTLVLDLAPNQPHRAEIAKMITRISHRASRRRDRLAARSRMHGSSSAARRLLVLDTAVDGGAAPLYEAVGFTLAGVIPDYALKPQGGLDGRIFYWKRIGAAEAA